MLSLIPVTFIMVAGFTFAFSIMGLLMIIVTTDYEDKWVDYIPKFLRDV